LISFFSAGEAAPKKIGILDIKNKNFRLHAVPLTQVRSFVTTEVSLREHREELDPDDPKVDSKVTKVLDAEVQLMVANARQKTEGTFQEAIAAGNDAGEKNSTIKYKLVNPKEVLVRVRVEHNGFTTLNNQRFGAKFVGEVANPTDMLLFHRKKDPMLKSTVKKKGINPIAPEDIARTNMEDLVHEHLAMPDAKLKLLEEKSLSEAMEEYVEKSQTGAITEIAKETLKNKQKELTKKMKEKKGETSFEKESQVVDLVDNSAQVDESAEVDNEGAKKLTNMKASRKKSQTAGKENSFDDDEEVEDFSTSKGGRPKRTVRDADTRDYQRKSAFDDDSDASSDEDIVAVARAAAKTKGKAPPRRSVKQKSNCNIRSDDDDDDDFVDGDDGEDEDFEVDANPKKRKAQATKGRGSTKSTSSRKGAASTSARRTNASKSKISRRLDDDSEGDSDIEYVGESAGLGGDWGSAATKSQKTQW
jgi:double-strand break repair protein MRE11